MKMRVGDPVIITRKTGRQQRGRVLGFSPREEWDAAKKRSYRFHDVIVTFPSGEVVTFPPHMVKVEAR